MTRRNFARVAFDPLTCYHGLGTPTNRDDDDAGVPPEVVNEMEAAAEDKSVPTLDADGTYHFDEAAILRTPDVLVPEVEALEEDIHQPLYLLSGIHPPQLEHAISQALDELCPELESTPRLEEKAFRIALSVGTEAVMVEGNHSDKIQKFRLKKSDMLESEDTEEVFGSFIVPFSK